MILTNACCVDFLADASNLHKELNFPDPFAFADYLGIRVIVGGTNESTSGPPAVIQYSLNTSQERLRFTIFHEIAHVLMQRKGYESHIIALNKKSDYDYVEDLANQCASIFLFPDHIVKEVDKAYGEHPNAIIKLADRCHGSRPAAMYRWVKAEPQKCRAGFVSNKNRIRYIQKVSRPFPVPRGSSISYVNTIKTVDAALVEFTRDPVTKKIVGIFPAEPWIYQPLGEGTLWLWQNPAMFIALKIMQDSSTKTNIAKRYDDQMYHQLCVCANYLWGVDPMDMAWAMPEHTLLPNERANFPYDF